MLRYITARLIQFPLILAVIYLTTFALVWIAPGSPFERTEKKLSAATIDSLKRKFHAETWYGFLAFYPYNVLVHGDLGPSMVNTETVNETIERHLPASVALGAAAIVIALLGGVAIGTLAAVYRNGPLDWISLNVAMIGISLPSFVAASVLIAMFAGHSRLASGDGKPRQERWYTLPSSGWPAGATREWSLMPGVNAADVNVKLHVVDINGEMQSNTFDPTRYTDRPNDFFISDLRIWATIKDYLRHLLLPAIALSLMPMAYITRLTRVSMIDVLGSDYVRTARAKGLSKPIVIWKHCLRNAILPVVSYVGPAAAGTMVGSFVVEQIFNVPGLGNFFVTSVQNRDQTLIIGTVMVESTLLLLVNLLVDLSYGFVDPRIDVTATRGES